MPEKNNKAYVLLCELIQACGYNVGEIEDEFDFDDLCRAVRRKRQEYGSIKEDFLNFRRMADNSIDELRKKYSRLRKATDKIRNICVTNMPNLPFRTIEDDILELIDNVDKEE